MPFDPMVGGGLRDALAAPGPATKVADTSLAPLSQQPMQVIPHPLKPGKWTIKVGNNIYGSFDRKDLAISTMLTRGQ